MGQWAGRDLDDLDAVQVLVASAYFGEPAWANGTVFTSPRGVRRRFRFETFAPATCDQLALQIEFGSAWILVLDVRLLARFGVVALHTLRQRSRGIEWLLGWEQPEPSYLELALTCRASGAIEWAAGAEQLALACDSVLAGELWFTRQVTRQLYLSLSRPPASDAGLTEREAEVLALVRQGLTNKLIASRLGISINTVKKHLTHAFAKRGLHTRRGA